MNPELKIPPLSPEDRSVSEPHPTARGSITPRDHLGVDGTVSSRPFWRLMSRAQLHDNADHLSGFILDTHTGTMSHCNDTAWTVVNAIERGADLDRIVDILTIEFDVARSEAERDARDFLWHLKRVEFADDR